MTKIKSRSIIDEIKECKGYDIALFTTYNIDLDFYEDQIKSILLNNKIRDICLFVDSKRFNQSITKTKKYDFGRQYYIYPIDIDGAFHPKVILLLGKGKAKLIVSSANLKVSSYRYNNEVFNSFDYSEKKNENSQLIKDSIDMFLQLQQISNELLNVNGTKYSFNDSSINKYLKNYSIIDHKTSNDCLLMNSINIPIIEQIKSTIGSKAKKIRIASPFYDSNMLVFKELISSFDCDDIEVFVQNISNSFPVEYNSKKKLIPESHIHVFNKLADGDMHFYHGKVIEFVCKNDSYILYGSPNCTTNALLKTYKDNGNIETAILCRSKTRNFDYFFDSFEIEEDLELESKFDIDKSVNETPFTFIYGQLENDIIDIYIKVKSRLNKMSIKYKDKQLKYDLYDELMIVHIPIEVFSEETSVFSLSITEDITSYTVDCWFNNYKEIQYFRQNIKNDNNDLDYIYEDENEADYYNFVMEAHRIIANSLNSNPRWFYDSSHNTVNVDDTDEYDDEDYDHILDDPTEDNYVERNNYSLLKRGIRSISANYYKSLLAYDRMKLFKVETDDKTKKDTNDLNRIQNHVPISSIKKLGRLIKRLTNHYLNDVNDSNMPVDTYIDLSGLVLHNIERYLDSKSLEESYKGFLSNDEVMDIKGIIAKNILSITKNNHDQIDKKIVLTIVLDYITVYGYFHKDAMKYDDREDLRRMLIELDDLYGIRDNISEIIDTIKLSLIEVYNLLGFDPKHFTDELFGYRSNSQLMEEYYQKYGKDNIESFDDGNTFTIQIDNCDLSKCKTIPISVITRITDSLYQSPNNYQYIKMIYRNEDQFITYVIEYAKKKNYINRVTQKNNLSGQIVSNKCIKHSNMYMPDIFNYV